MSSQSSTCARPAIPTGVLVKEAAGRFARLGMRDARRDALLLLSSVLGIPSWRLIAEPEQGVGTWQMMRFLALADRRAAHEPIAYLLGEREFWGRSFRVGREVLVPRPETEGLVEAALRLAGCGDITIADVGTGSGCIAVTLALELEGASIVATDRSPEALRLARCNAARHGVAGRIDFRSGEDLAPLVHLSGRLDMLVSNPPYVAEGEWPGLAEEIRAWEPRSALIAGPTGLEVLERICDGASRVLRPGGSLLLEVGEGQAAAVRRRLAGWRTAVERDLAGIERIVLAASPGGGR